MNPDSPVYDPFRLDLIRQAHLLTQEHNETFDRLTRIVTQLLRVPSAAITVVHPNGQTFIGAAGLSEAQAEARGTPLTESYCKYVVDAGVPLITRDARQHPLLHDNPAIENDAIAYAGLPLVVEGETVGTLCAIDSKPRKWTAEDLELLGEIGELAIAAIELRLLRSRAPGAPGLPQAVDESRFDAVFQHSRSGMCILTPEGKVMRCNPAMEGLLGTTQDRILWSSFADFVHPADREAASAAVAAVVEGKEPYRTVEGRCVTAAGDTVWGRATVAAVRGIRGELVCLILMKDDITPERHARAALGERDEQLAQSQKMDALGKLAAGIAHDFNNILSVITAYSGIALSDAEPGSDLHENLTAVETAARKAAVLTRQLLTFSRRTAPRLAPVDVNEIVRGMQKMLAPIFPPRVQITTALAADPALVITDPTHLEQVVMNLAVNARDAMPDGGTLSFGTCNRRVDTGASDDEATSSGAYVELTVSDTGTGIPESLLPRIFEAFFTTKPVGEGTGLGLATVQGIVHRMGGTIAVKSELNRGTQFRVTLPAARTAS